MGYEVKNGDGWYRIAKSQGIDVNELLALNNATLDTMLHPGQQIKTSKPVLVSKKEPVNQANNKSETPTQEVTTNEPEQVNPMNPYGTYVAWSPTYKRGENCGVDGCAKYANDSLKEHKDSKGRRLYSATNIGGHAWTRLTAGKDNNMIYSGYEGTEYDTSNAKDRETYQAYLEAVRNNDTKAANRYAAMLQSSVGRLSVQRNKAAADRFMKEFDSSTLDKNKTYMVNMYYAGSPNAGVAWYGAENGTTGTHTGNVYWDPKTERWRISHNVHGTVKDDDFIQTQGSRRPYAVTAIAEAVANDYTEADRREDYRQRKPIRGWIRDKLDFWKEGGTLIPKANGGMELPEVTVTAINPNRPGISTDGKKFIQGVNEKRNQYMQDYGMSDSEFADLAKSAVNIAQQESSMGTGKRYLMKKMAGPGLVSLAKIAKSVYNGQELNPNNLAVSRGLTQIKYNEDIKNPELKALYDKEGITYSNLALSPKKSAHATLARLYHNDQNMQPIYRWSDGSAMDSDTARALYWNFGQLTDLENPSPAAIGTPAHDGEQSTYRAARFEKNRLVK